MGEFKERWKASSPKFFKKLKKMAFKVGGACVVMLTAINTIPFMVLPSWVSMGLSFVIFMCAGIAGTSQLTKDDKA
jgi:hypothetical protein